MLEGIAAPSACPGCHSAMPIRFACPHCRQKLSVSSRKAGTRADCPRCKRSLSIPDLPPEPEVSRAAIEPIRTPANIPAAPEPVPEQFATAVAEEPVAVAEAPAVEPPAEVTFTPDVSEFEGLDLVYDSTEPTELNRAATTADVVAIPRYALYLQGGLLAVVALGAFTIGVLTGGALLTQPAAPAAPQACTVSGSVMFASGARELPDAGAVIAIVPQNGDKPDEKAPVDGLRPGDPTPGGDHRGIAILRGIGGDYARADANGRFQLKLPDRGRYLVLAISNQKLLRSVDEIKTADILKIGPYFNNAAGLLGNHQYQVLHEQIRGDRELSVTFE